MRSLWSVVLAVGLLSCAAKSPRDEPPAVQLQPPPTVETAVPPALLAIRDPGASSSALALATLGGRPAAALADEDERALILLDLEHGDVRATLSLPGRPGHVIIDGDGRLFVSIRDANLVVIATLRCRDDRPECEPTLVEHRRIATAAEPIGLGLVDEDATVLVTCGWGRVLQGHALRYDGSDFEIALGRAPRGFAVDPRGDRAYVAHAMGSRVTVVSLLEQAVERERALDWRDDVVFDLLTLTNVPRFAVQGSAIGLHGRQAHAPMVLAYPGEEELDAAGYGATFDGIAPFFPHEPVLATIGPAGRRARLRTRRHVVDADEARQAQKRRRYPESRPPCLLPRGVAVDRHRDRLLVACMDIGQVVEFSLLDEDLARAESRRWTVGAGANAIAIHPDLDVAWAWSQFDRRLTRLSLRPAESAPPPSVVEVPASAHVVAETGRRLFHKPLAFDGRSCASCHVDGRNDGLVWQSPTGMVATPVLASRAATSERFGWHGEKKTLVGHVRRTFARLRAGKPDDASLEALGAYLTQMPTLRLGSGALTSEQRRGRELFHAREVGCADCHLEGDGVDGLRHRIGPGPAVDTPSLRFVGDTAPYMKDGSYATLRELLSATDGRMGSTAHLGDADLAALIAYLRVL